MFRNTNSVTLCQNSVFFFFAKLSGCQNEVFEKKFAFCVFLFLYVGEMETEKKTTRMEKAKKNNKNRVFKVVIQKCEKSKKRLFSKN